MKKLALAYLSLFIKAWQKGRLYSRRCRAGVTIVFLTSAGMATAQTWNGGGSSPLDWTDPTNWAGGVPGSNATVNVAGAGGGALTNVYSGFANQHRLFFNSGAGSYTLNGPGPVTFFDFGGAAPKIENNATGTTQTINFATILNGTAGGGFAEVNPVDGNLVLNNTLDLAGTTQMRVWGNNGNRLTVEGAVSSSGNGGNNTIAINQNSVLYLKGANTYNGSTFVNAGELRLGNSTQGTGTIELGDTVGSANALFSLTNNATTGAGVAITKAVNVRTGSSGVKSIGGSGVVSNTLSGNIAMSNPLTFAPSAGAQLRLTGVISGAQPVTVNGAGLTAFGGINTFTGQTTVKSGATLGLIPTTFTLGTSGTLGAGGVGNETIVESGGTINVGGANFGNQAPGAANNEIFRIAGTGVGGAGALINTSAQNNTLTLSKVVLTADATISQGGNNQVSYGSGGNIITGNGRTDIRQNAAPTAGQAHLDLAGNTLTVAGNHLLAIVASDISGGSFIVNSGQLNLETTTIFNTGTGNITVNPGGRLGYYSSVANQVMAVTRPVILNGGMYGDITNTAQVWTAPSPVTITGSQNPTFSAINGGLNSISGQITQSSFTGTGVDKRGTGQLGFTNIANSFSAPVNIYAGTLRGDYSTALAGGVAPAAAATTTDTPLGTSNVINLMGGTLSLRANMANDATNQRWAHPAAITIDRAPAAMTFDRIGNATQTDKNVFFPSITIAPRSASNAWSIGQNQFTFTQANTHRLEFTNLSMGNDTLLSSGDFTFSGDVTSAGRNSLLKNGGNSWGFIGGSTQEFNSMFIYGNAQTRVGSMYGTGVTSNTATAGTGPIFQAPNNAITFRDTGNIAAGQIVEIKSQMQTQSTVNFENNWTAVPSNLRAAGGGVLGVGNATNFGAVNLYNLGDGTFRIGAGFGGTASGAISGTITPGAGGVVRTGGGGNVVFTGANAITGTGTSLEVGSDLLNGLFRSSFNFIGQTGVTFLTQANNYTGGTVVNRSSTLNLQAANTAGTGAITTYGTITLASGGTLASGTANTNAVNFRPGSTLTMDNSQANLDRWGDAAAVSLNSTAFRLIGNNNASGTTETVGAVSVAGNSNLHVARTTAGNTTLAAGNLTRTGTGIATISTSAAGTLGGVDRLTVANGTAFQTGGANVVGTTDVVKPWLTNTTDKAYLTYGASGFVNKVFNVNFSAAAAAPAWANTDVVNVSAAPTNAISQDILGLRTSVALSPASTSGTGAALQGLANGTTWNIRTGGLFHTGAANTVVTPAISFAANTGGAAVEGFFYNDNTIDMGTLQVTSTTVTAYTNISTDGVITAGAGLVKAGAGSLRLNSVQNITGGVTIQNGNVELRNPTNTTTISPLGTNTITFAGNSASASPSLNLRATASQTFNNPVVMAAELPLASIDSNNSGNGTPTIALPSLTMNGSTHAQGQTINISGANTFNLNGAAASPALTLATGGSFTINNAITTQVSTGTNQGITFNTATPTTLIKAGGGNLILGNASTNNPAVGSRAVVNGGTLELRSITSLGSGSNTTIDLNTGTLNLRRDSAATYGGTAATGYTTRVNGNSTISVDRVSAGNVNVGLGKLIVNNDAQVTVNHGNNFGLIFENGADLRGSGLIVSNITGIQNQDTALRMNAAVTGGSLVKLGGGHLHLMATSTFDGGLYANAGYTRLRAAGAAGTGTVVLNPGATLDFNAANNLNVGQQLIVRSTPAAMAMISMNADVAHPTTGVDTTNATTGIIGLSNSPTGVYNTPINMAALYGGGWSLGGISQGAYDPRYTASTLGAGSGNLYRLGGGGTSFFLGFDAASAPQNNVLTGATNSVRIGFDSGNIYTGSSGTAGNYQFTLGGSNDYGGSTVIHRGTAARSLAAVTGSNSAFGSGAVDVFGSLILSGTGTLVDGSGNATNALTMHPGSSLVLDNNGSAQAVAVTNAGDRIANAQAINLKGSLIDFIGNSNNPSTETLGTVTIGASSRLRAARNGTGTTALTITNLAGTTTAGNSLLLQASAAAQLGLPAGDRIIASNLGTVAMVDPRVVNYTDGQFVGHDATNGFVNLTANVTTLTTAGSLTPGLSPATNLNIAMGATTGNQTLVDNMVINSLRTDRDIVNGGPFNRITLRSGGLLSATNALTIQPDLVFNDGTNNIEARITAISNLFIQGQLTANGITKAGAGQMFVRVPQPNYASGWTLNSGDLIFDDPQAAGQSVAANAINVNGSTSTGGLNTATGFGNLLSSNLGASTRLIFRYDNQSPENITFTGGPINVLNDATIQITPFGVATNATANDRNMTIPAISLASDSTLSSAGLNIDIPNSRNRTVTPSLTLNSNGTLRVLDGGSTGDYGRINSFAVNSLVGSGKNLLKIGNRPLELRNDNSATYTGGSITVGQGTVVVGHNGSLGSTSTAVTIERNATLEIARSVFAPVNTSFTQNAGSSERWDQEDARVATGGTYNLPAGVNLQLNTNILNARTIGLNGGTVEGFLYSDHVVQANLRTMESGVTLNLLANSYLGNALYTQGATYDTGRQPTNAAANPFGDTYTGSMLDIRGPITGAFDLTKTGLDTVQISGTSNTYNNTRVDMGILRIGANNALPTGKALVTRNGGIFDLYGFNQTVGELGTGTAYTGGGITVGSSGKITNSGVVMNTLTASQATDTTYNGLIERNVSVAKSGAGVLTLGNPDNTYRGTTTISGGTLSVSKLANGSTTGNDITSSIGQSTSDAANLNFSGSGILRYTGGTASTDRRFTLGDTGGGFESNGSGPLTLSSTATVTHTGSAARTLTLSGSNTGANTFAGVLGNGTGTSGLTKDGAGKWTISGVSSYSGTTNVKNGTLTLAATADIPNTTSIDVKTGATLDVSALSSLNVNGADVTVNGTITGGITSTTGTDLFGNGSITGPVDFSGATSVNTVNPGNSPGTLSTGSFTTTGGANATVFNFEIGGVIPGADYDRISTTGAINLNGGTLVVSLINSFVPVDGTTFDIWLNDGSEAIGGSLTTFDTLANNSTFGVPETADPYDYWSINYFTNADGGTTGNDIRLLYVPEPSSALLAGAAGAILLRRRRTVKGQA